MNCGMQSLVNAPAVPFRLSDADGNPFSLDDFAGRHLLLVFHRHLG